MPQPSLFPVIELPEGSSIHIDAKVTIALLYRVRRKLHQAQQPITDALDHLIKEIRFFGKLTPTQWQGLVLWAVEKRQCWTATEIAAEIKFKQSEVQAILQELERRGFLRSVRRHLLGCSKKYYMYKSNRIHSPDGD